MDVEGLLNLEDYVPPQAEKQIAKIPAPKYEIDPGFWQLGDPPPTYEDLFEEKEPLAIEGPPDDDDDENKFVDAEEGGDDDAEEEQEEESEEDPNKIFDKLKLPNYNDVDMRLAEPDMTPAKKKSYLTKINNDAEKERQKITPLKSKATRDFKAGRISKQERDLIHSDVGKIEREIKAYRKHYESKLYSIKGSGLRRGQRGRGAYFFNDAKEMLQKLTLIIAEMEAGNTSIKMRNMGQTILDALLHANHLNKVQYRKLVKKYFAL